MMQPPKPGAPGPSMMKTFKVTVPQATYDALERQAAQYGSLKQHVAPILIALGAGEIRPRYEYAPPPALPPVPAPASIAQRIGGIKGLSGTERALLALVCEEYSGTNGDRTVATNAELGQQLGVSGPHVKRVVSALEDTGWLSVKLYANGANGRQLWPTVKTLVLLGSR